MGPQKWKWRLESHMGTSVRYIIHGLAIPVRKDSESFMGNMLKNLIVH